MSNIERAVIAGIYGLPAHKREAEETLLELEELVIACGGQVVGKVLQHLKKPDSRYLIGPGKAVELSEWDQKTPVDFFVFDDELTPSQQRSLEQLLKKKVIDRTRLILDIFAQRAQTAEARLQVELAQLQYMLPRLTGLWQHFGQAGAGIGTRGPGETQLEVDRRRVREKITFLKKKLEKVSTHRQVIRSNNKERVSIVGYTNAGKSSLLAKLSGKEVFVKNQLFATLDPLVREVWFQELSQTIPFVDTVGFIRKLPTQLVDAFKATLEELKHAKALVHVVDASHPQLEQHLKAVYLLLEDFQAVTKPIFTIFNKADQLKNQDSIKTLLTRYTPSRLVSLLNADDVKTLQRELGSWLKNL